MLLINGNIVSMDGGDFDNGYVYIIKNKISQVGDMANCDIKDDETYDMQGRFVFPGFIDAHSHIGMWEDGIGIEGADGNEESDPVTPHVNALDGINPHTKSFQEALESGITTVVSGPGSSNVIAGNFVALHTVGNCTDEMLLTKSAGMKFSLGENPKMTYNQKDQAPFTRMSIAALIREQLYKAKHYHEAKKQGENPEYCIKCEALKDVLHKKVPAYFHVHRADDICTAIRIGEEFDLDIVLIHATEACSIINTLEQKNVKFILGPVICDRSKPELVNFKLNNFYTVANHKNANDENFIFAICTDYPEIPSQYLWLCCKLLMEENPKFGNLHISFERILKALTVNAAKICGISDFVGSLTPGKLADIVVFDKDFIQKLMPAPYMVIVNGNLHYS